MVDDGEAQDEVGPHPVDERRALARPPAEPGRRVGEVEDERQDPPLALAAEIAVEAVDDDVVGVDGDDRRAPASRASRENRPSLAPRSSTSRGRPRPTAAATNRSLARRSPVGVVGPVAVVRPRRRPACPTSAPSIGLLEVAQLGVDQAGAEPGPLELGLDVALAVGVGVPALGPGVQLDVGEHALLKPARAAQQLGRGRRRDAVDAPPQQRLEGTSREGLDEQRVEEQLAELAVAGPRLAGAEPLERADVDEDRLGADELDVVRRWRPW